MKELSDSALRKIGRNLVNLSKIEGMLKLLLSRINFQCPVTELQATLEAKRKKYETMTLGQVSKHYFETYNSDTDSMHQHPEDRKKAWVSFSFTTETESLDLQKKEFDFLVEERNKLVHQLLIKFNPKSENDCKDLIKKLDNQDKDIQRHFKYLKAQLYALNQSVKQLFLDRAGLIKDKKFNKKLDEILRKI
ncbi:MAG: hypothetical protein KDI52_11140 [Xanthomonadales bacterium]|nr:hypothetical protein [Xanthomonadales bacterium]